MITMNNSLRKNYQRHEPEIIFEDERDDGYTL